MILGGRVGIDIKGRGAGGRLSLKEGHLHCLLSAGRRTGMMDRVEVNQIKTIEIKWRLYQNAIYSIY
jgi:hypothetical protein